MRKHVEECARPRTDPHGRARRPRRWRPTLLLRELSRNQVSKKTLGRRKRTLLAAGRGRGGRFSAGRKREVVMRLLRGEDLEFVSRELGITAARASQWRDRFLAAGQASLKSRAPDAWDEANRRLQAKIPQDGQCAEHASHGRAAQGESHALRHLDGGDAAGGRPGLRSLPGHVCREVPSRDHVSRPGPGRALDLLRLSGRALDPHPDHEPRSSRHSPPSGSARRRRKARAAGWRA